MDRLKAEVRRLKLNHPAYFMPKSLQSSVYLPDGSGSSSLAVFSIFALRGK
ncbi:hypothetical protein M1O20_05715 [Dehalococcoidia bacterium]|nr:hypothetical protein [Dehalococcoidia bacterium]MCL0059957.1 hypothetical protein [Dehalococcoidia bacterium]MCL0082719.1 hypothetical protein [Dehalococcoidia bacterium]